MPANAERAALKRENERLRARLLEQGETLRAIRSGEVDALVVETAGADQVFTLKSADQTYRFMVEQMRKGAATLSEEGLVLYCNPFLAELLGVSLEAVLGAPISAFLDEKAAEALKELRRTAQCGLARGEISFRRPQGSVPTQVSLTVLPLEGEPVVCMIVTDLTERKRQEEERSQLEHEQAARTAADNANRISLDEIERRKGIEASLREAEKQRTELLQRERVARTDAEEANRLKDEFLATLSHELRTPLSAILTWAHVLRQSGLDPAVTARAVDAIDRNARAQTAIVANLLDVSQIVAGQFHMNLGPVELAVVIEAAVASVRPAATIKKIGLEVTVDPAVGPVLGDASRLQQVVWNLLSNAIRLAPAGGRVDVRVEAKGSGIELSVADDGAGIDPSFLPHVFDRFRQADSSTTRRHAGLGLGLAMVRHLVELHGGSVEARNRDDGPGALFIVRLPRPLEAGAPEHESEEAMSSTTSLAGVRVLLVDDDVETVEALAMALRRCGAVVTATFSARQALALLTQERPDVLVADIGMPHEDGHDLLRKVRALDRGRGGATPAIALTAYASVEDRREILRTGFQIHLPKPVTPAALAVAITSLAARERATLSPDGSRAGA